MYILTYTDIQEHVIRFLQAMAAHGLDKLLGPADVYMPGFVKEKMAVSTQIRLLQIVDVSGHPNRVECVQLPRDKLEVLLLDSNLRIC